MDLGIVGAFVAMFLYVAVLQRAAKSAMTGWNKALVIALATLVLVVLMSYAPHL